MSHINSLKPDYDQTQQGRCLISFSRLRRSSKTSAWQIFTLLRAGLFNIYVQHYGGVAHTAARPQCCPSDHQTSTTAPPLCRQFPVTLPRSEMVNGLLKGGGDTDPDDSRYQSEGYFSAFHIDVIILKNTLTLSEHSAGR